MTKILLVEDDKSLREIYGYRLQAEGYDISSAGDGEEALALAIKERPMLILSDVMMPKISGFDMLDILRSTTETRDIKVIMMTALSSEDQRARGEALGADRYLVKSQVGIEDVVRTVHEVLGDAPAPVAAPSFPSTQQQAQPAPQPAAPTYIPPAPAPEPIPAPQPVAAPVQQPVYTAPAPAPQPEPVAAPQPAPASAYQAPVDAYAAPAPTPTAAPAPQPMAAPEPAPQPAPQPVAPTYTPPAPVAQPQPVAAPAPVQAPAADVNPFAVPQQPEQPTQPAPAPQPAPQPAAPTYVAPAPNPLPAPTAPFSTPRPASLGDRVINPISSPESINSPNDVLSVQLEQELNGGSFNPPASSAQ